MNEELIAALRRNMVETGSLICLGCGHEHSCSAHGCAIMREAADALERLGAENSALHAQTDHSVDVNKKVGDNPPLTLEELRGMDGEPVWIEDWWEDFHGWELSADARDYYAERDTTQCGKLWSAYRRKPEEKK